MTFQSHTARPMSARPRKRVRIEIRHICSQAADHLIEDLLCPSGLNQPGLRHSNQNIRRVFGYSTFASYTATKPMLRSAQGLAQLSQLIRSLSALLIITPSVVEHCSGRNPAVGTNGAVLNFARVEKANQEGP